MSTLTVSSRIIQFFKESFSFYSQGDAIIFGLLGFFVSYVAGEFVIITSQAAVCKIYRSSAVKPDYKNICELERIVSKENIDNRLSFFEKRKDLFDLISGLFGLTISISLIESDRYISGQLSKSYIPWESSEYWIISLVSLVFAVRTYAYMIRFVEK